MLALFLLYVFWFGYLVGVTGSTLQELTLVVSLHNLFQFITFEQVRLYFCLLCLVYCIVDITLRCFASYMTLFVFWLSLIAQFTAAFSLGCTDLCKVGTEDSDHVISWMVVLIAEIEGHCF